MGGGPTGYSHLTTQMKSFDMTTFLLLNFLKAKEVGILAGRLEQNGFSMGSHTVNSGVTRESTFSRFRLERERRS